MKNLWHPEPCHSERSEESSFPRRPRPFAALSVTSLLGRGCGLRARERVLSISGFYATALSLLVDRRNCLLTSGAGTESSVGAGTRGTRKVGGGLSEQSRLL